MKLGLKPMTVGAMIGGHYNLQYRFGLKHTRNEPLRTNKSQFYALNTTTVFPYVPKQEWMLKARFGKGRS